MSRDIRQVPDSQEVFVYTDSDSFLSVEVLQRVPKDDDTEAVKWCRSTNPTRTH